VPTPRPEWDRKDIPASAHAPTAQPDRSRDA
jgi:hypothetical protein